MARGTNLDHTREYNRRAVLAALRRLGTASRTEVAEGTGLSLTAVSSLVEDLVRDGWVAARGRRATARGQPPIQFELAGDGAYGVGIAFDRDHAVGALVDLGGRSLAEIRRAVADPTPDEAACLVREMERDLVARLARQRRDRILGLGVAVPGVVGADGRVQRMIRLPSWEGVDARTRLGDAVGRPVTVANDAVAASVGEVAFGGADAWGTVCYVLFALGLGSALMMEGRPHRGLWGFSGRLGHIPVDPAGEPCPSCGGRGCLSLYASLEVLEGRLDGASDAEVERRFARGDAIVEAWLDEAAAAFGRAMLVLENLLAPDVLILDGRIPAGVGQALAGRATARYEALRPRRPRRDGIVLRLGSRGGGAAAYGAATLPLYLATAPDLSLVR